MVCAIKLNMARRSFQLVCWSPIVACQLVTSSCHFNIVNHTIPTTQHTYTRTARQAVPDQKLALHLSIGCTSRSFAHTNVSIDWDGVC